jgi:hypothetical protein
MNTLNKEIIKPSFSFEISNSIFLKIKYLISNLERNSAAVFSQR